MRGDILKGYEDAAGDLIQSFEGISSAELLGPVSHHFPQYQCHVLDVGAGTGRDAAWFASLSHSVVAVEPVDALRNAGIAKHKSPNISWINDSLPQLSKIITLGETFDIILLCAVWQHLNDTDRRFAFSTFRRLISDNGIVVMSIRHGTGAPTRSVYPANIPETLTWAEQQQFSKLCEVSTQSAQEKNRHAGVTWTWLVLHAEN